MIVRFPHSDLSTSKLRPAVIVAHAEHDDVVLCQVTSRPYASRMAMQITASDFSSGGLGLTSYVRPDKLFTASRSIVRSTAGTLHEEPLGRLVKAVVALFSA